MIRRFFVVLLLLPLAPVAALDFIGLQAALRAAKPGDTVVVPAGNYVGQLVLDRPVVLRAEAGARLAHEAGAGGPTLWIRAEGVRVEGLALYGSGEGGRRDHTAVVVSAGNVVLSGLSIHGAWAGVWVEKADAVVIDGLTFRGLADFPFWERGEGVRVTDSTGTRLRGLDLAYASDGVAVENGRNTAVADSTVVEARYGVHLMFSAQGSVSSVSTRRTVAGLMIMESSDWKVSASSFTEGFRTGSAGIRQIRTTGIVLQKNRVARQASGLELLDARNGTIGDNRIEENAVAWAWGGDNEGTLITGNVHRGNLVDAAGSEPADDSLSSDAHDHKGTASTPVSGRRVAPRFDANSWDAWTGLDLDGDGFGDTPYLFDRDASVRAVSRPWAGLFLGSPWSVLSQSLPGGEVLDRRPVSPRGQNPTALPKVTP